MVKVSVIILIYNREKYIKECIDSIVKQTIFRDVELILVNDGSTDNSEKICLEYVQKYTNIKYFYQENQGVSAARNFGIEQASGEYISFIDSDDAVNNIFMESAYNNAIENNADFVIVGGEKYAPEKSQIFYLAMSTWQMFLKKSLLDKYPDIRFNTQISLGEDNLLSFQLMHLSNKISIENNSIYYYRDTEDSLVSKQKNNLYFIEQRKRILFCGLNPFYKKYKDEELEQKMARFTCFYLFWFTRLLRFNFKQFILTYSIINEFIIMNKLKFIYLNFSKYTSKFNLLYFLFNVAFLPSIIVGYIRDKNKA